MQVLFVIFEAFVYDIKTLIHSPFCFVFMFRYNSGKIIKKFKIFSHVLEHVTTVCIIYFCSLNASLPTLSLALPKCFLNPF